jgi:hypothetical protein
MNSHHHMETSLFYLHFMYINPQIPHPSRGGRNGHRTSTIRIITSIYLYPLILRPSASLTACAYHHTSSLNALGTLAVKSYEPGSPLNCWESLTSSFYHPQPSILINLLSKSINLTLLHHYTPFKSLIITLLGYKPDPKLKHRSQNLRRWLILSNHFIPSIHVSYNLQPTTYNLLLPTNNPSNYYLLSHSSNLLRLRISHPYI